MAMAVVYTQFCGMLVHETRNGVDREYLPDPLGSTAALLDSNQQISDSWEYWPYGEVMSRTGTNPTPFTYVGLLGYFQEILDKLTYIRARWYQPAYARWTTVDSLWPWEGAYSSFEQSPVSHTDASGTQAISPHSSDLWEKWCADMDKDLKRTFEEISKRIRRIRFKGVPPVYGNYCGPQSGDYSYPPSQKDRPAPIDSLDTCCKEHDDCFAAHGCNVANQVFKKECRKCNRELCECAKQVTCSSKKCKAMKGVVIGYACSPTWAL